MEIFCPAFQYKHVILKEGAKKKYKKKKQIACERSESDRKAEREVG